MPVNHQIPLGVIHSVYTKACYPRKCAEYRLIIFSSCGPKIQCVMMEPQCNCCFAGRLRGQIDLLKILNGLHGAIGTVPEAQVCPYRDPDLNDIQSVVFIPKQTMFFIPVMKGMGDRWDFLPR